MLLEVDSQQCAGVPLPLYGLGLTCVDRYSLLARGCPEDEVEMRLGLPYLGVGVGAPLYLVDQVYTQICFPSDMPDDVRGDRQAAQVMVTAKVVDCRRLESRRTASICPAPRASKRSIRSARA